MQCRILQQTEPAHYDNLWFNVVGTGGEEETQYGRFFIREVQVYQGHLYLTYRMTDLGRQVFPEDIFRQSLPKYRSGESIITEEVHYSLVPAASGAAVGELIPHQFIPEKLVGQIEPQEFQAGETLVEFQFSSIIDLKQKLVTQLTPFESLPQEQQDAFRRQTGGIDFPFGDEVRRVASIFLKCSGYYELLATMPDLQSTTGKDLNQLRLEQGELASQHKRGVSNNPGFF